MLIPFFFLLRDGDELAARINERCESMFRAGLVEETRSILSMGFPRDSKALESIGYREGRRPERRLGHAQDSDPALVERLPEAAQRLVTASADLYARVKRLDDGSVAEITQLDDALSRKKNVGRFDIAVNDAFTMGVI